MTAVWLSGWTCFPRRLAFDAALDKTRAIYKQHRQGVVIVEARNIFPSVSACCMLSI